MPAYKLLATAIGSDAGPFDIKTDTGAVLATGVTRLQLLAGYIVNVPLGVVSLTVSNSASNTVCDTTQTYTVPNEGYWEMEKTGVETVSDHYGVILTPYVVPVESFVAQDVVGINSGVVSGTGTWLIKAGPEDIGGTTYPGGGTLATTATNTNTATTVESGATMQLGYDLNGLDGRVAGVLTINAPNGAVNVVGANETPGRTVFDSVTNNGALTFEGPDVCGEGYFQNNGVIINTGLITVKDNANFRFINSTTFSGGAGTWRVEGGGTIEQNGRSLPANQTFYMNGCGKCNNIGKEVGAFYYGGVSTISSPFVLESDTCFKTTGAVGLTTFAGPISGNFKLSLDNVTGSAARVGTVAFTSNTAPFFDGTLEVQGTSLYGTGANALSKADVVFLELGGIQSDGGAIQLGSLSSPDATTFVLLNSSGSITLKENGETTFAGLLQNSTPGTPWPLTLDGPATNKLTLTGAGSSAVNLASNTGSRIVVQGGYFNQWTGTGTISGGASTAGRINTLTINASSALDVYTSGTGTGRLWASNALNLTAGWQVNVMDNLAAGTYNILQKPNAVAVTLPVIGTNASGLTATFANVGNMITMTLA